MNTYRIIGYNMMDTDKTNINSMFEGKTMIEALGKALKREITDVDIMPKDKYYPALWMYNVKLWSRNGKKVQDRVYEHYQLRNDYVK